jgi:hypothetical protein
MAKSSKGGSSSPSRKISFGKKRSGVAKKGYSKYEQKPKKYRRSRKINRVFSFLSIIILTCQIRNEKILSPL